MYDPFLIAHLSDREWRLLGTLLLTRQQSTTFKRRELMAKSGLNKNNLNLARADLIKKGLIAVRSLGGDGVEYTIIPRQQGEAFWEASEVKASTPTLPQPSSMAILAPPKPVDTSKSVGNGGSDAVALVIAAYADLFPVDEKYPLTPKKAAEMLALGEGNVEHVLSVFNRVALKPDVKSPKAYIVSILTKEKPPKPEPGAEVIEPVYYALMKRRKDNANA